MKTVKHPYPTGLLIAFAIVFVPISAQSEEIPARGPIPFSTYDKDGNSLISKKEFNAVRGKRMASRAAEGRPMRGAVSAPSFSEFDMNNDGQLTPDELTAGQKAQMEKRRGRGMGQGRGRGMGRNMPTFSEYDLNGDGKILEAELNEARSKRISERAKQGYRMRNLGNSPSFSDIDTNADGEISPKEFTTHQSRHRKANKNQFASDNSASSGDDTRQLVSIPAKARQLMRKDMLTNLSVLSAIIGYLAENNFEAAAEAAEAGMGKSTMGRHRGTGAAPGWFMTNEMRNIGRGMHEAASEFSKVAKQGDIKTSMKALKKMSDSCVACHYSYRTR